MDEHKVMLTIHPNNFVKKTYLEEDKNQRTCMPKGIMCTCSCLR